MLKRNSIIGYCPHIFPYGNEEYCVDVPAVVFPVGAVVQQNKMLIYAGAADKYIILLTCKLDSLIDYLLVHCKL